MPWNDQKGPWGGGGGSAGGNNGGSGGGDDKSPWGRGGPKPGGSGGGGGGPDLEESLRKMQERFRQRRAGGSGGGNGAGGRGTKGGRGGLGGAGLIVLLVVALVGWFLTGVFQVNEQSRAVVLRFGKVHRDVGPGFYVRLPDPIERHITVEVNANKATEVGLTPEESLMLTGDENIIDIDFIINWKIDVPELYLFNISRGEELVKQVGESSMREVVGSSNYLPLTNNDLGGLQTRVQQLMQTTLNEYGAGIEVTSISILSATPPPEVIGAQRDVASAEQDRSTKVNEAVGYRNSVVPKARGEAQKLLQDAEGYRDSMIATANGEAERFRLIYEEYQKAPRVTRERMFLETMERVIARSDTIILDTKSGAVPFLPLDQLRRGAPAKEQ